MSGDETITLEEYNKYAKAEEAKMPAKPRVTLLNRGTDPRDEYWAERLCVSTEVDYDAEGNPV